MYQIEYDPNSGILTGKSEGYWSTEEAVSYGIELERQIKDARRRCGKLLLLIDSTEAKIQSAAVIQKLEDIARDIELTGDDKAAVVVLSALKKLQVERFLK